MSGDVAGHHQVVRLGRDDFAAVGVDDQVDVGEHPTGGAGAGDHAVVGLMGVARDDDVDLVAHTLDDVQVRFADAVALVDAPAVGLHAALVEQHDNGVDALLPQLGEQALHGVGLVDELEALDPGRGDQPDHDDRRGGRQSSGVRAPFDRFADALTATRASARVRSFAKSRLRCVAHPAPPAAFALANGTIWSTSSSDGSVKRWPV